MVLLSLKKATSTMHLKEQIGIGFKNIHLASEKWLKTMRMEKHKKSVNTLEVNQCLG